MRTTYGAARAKAKRRLFKRAKGNRGGRRNLLRTVKETEVRSGAYSYRDRKVRARDFRRLWITRLNAACRAHDLRYSQFIHGLNQLTSNWIASRSAKWQFMTQQALKQWLTSSKLPLLVNANLRTMQIEPCSGEEVS